MKLCYFVLLHYSFLSSLSVSVHPVDEVRVKTKALERTQIKVKAAEEEISDLQAEFEIDRQDYLETIRRQEQMLLLQQQLLETMVPLVRRDCNYYNLDRVRTECKFDEDAGKWVVPKVVLSSNSLSTVNPISYSPNHNPSGRRTLRDRDTDPYAHRLQKSEEPEYFKQRRAQELLAECNIMKEGLSPEKNRRQFRGNIGTGPGPSSTGRENRLHQKNDVFARPRKLDSLVHPVVNTGKTSAIQNCALIINLTACTLIINLNVLIFFCQLRWCSALSL